MNNKIYTVSELSVALQKYLDDAPAFSGLWVRGEISNFKQHMAGHLYLSLKDKNCSIRAVMFRSRAAGLKFLPQDGMECLVRGYVSLYPKDTQLQLYVEEIIPAGAGIQYLALEELKKKLQAKGYFAAERKRALPFLPREIGVVSSPVGAVIKDIQQVIQRRYPGMPIVLYPAVVQGDKAGRTLVEGLQVLGKRAGTDVVILARGGGSVEDLAVFNTEEVAEAVFACPKPVISAVGHEGDYTIADLVADRRAATPSVAAELAVPVKGELQQLLDKMRDRLQQALESRVEREKIRLAFYAEAGVLRRPQRWINVFFEELVKKESGLQRLWEELLQAKTRQLETAAGKLQALSPLSTLSRGYCICTDSQARIITDSRRVKVDERLDIRLSTGRLSCNVVGKEEE